MFQGQSIQLIELGEGLIELQFQRGDETVNKLDRRTVNELRQASEFLAMQPAVRGVLVTSGKEVFIVGADIGEFGELFKLPEQALELDSLRSNSAFTAFEDLPFPTVVAINGYALGGGLEMALSGDYRVLSSQAQIGLPEVKLGLFPGFGGTVRLPRVASADVAIEWITSGKVQRSSSALAAGVVDQVVEPEALRDTALKLLHEAVEGAKDWKTRRMRKLLPQPTQAQRLFEAAKGPIQARSPKHQPAALAALELMALAAGESRKGAQALECKAFARIAKSQAAASLVQAFLNEQMLKKTFRTHAGQSRKLTLGAVLGAGIMGGGIAYTSALRGTPVRLKDIAQAQLDLGICEAQKLLTRQVKNGRLSEDKAPGILSSISPQLDYTGFELVDMVVEAVVENLKVKHAVLCELESVTRDDCVIASNTSSLRIDDLAAPLARPQNFVGMHFFNPVPVMALVEVIQGEKTSDEAVSTAVSYALAMGKTPIVVKDCPGFLVNRILTPYIMGFTRLVTDGADFAVVDRVLEAFGWPMGPAYLQDVVGMDTGNHVVEIISAGYPQRMSRQSKDAVALMVENGRFGQKNGLGFYRYEADPNGKPKKTAAVDTYKLLAAVQPVGRQDFDPETIIERCMLPLILEAVHCLEEGVVASATELDTALLLGIGFPAYLGGALKYADWLGLSHLVALCDTYAPELGPMYEATDTLRVMAAQGRTFY